MLLGNLTCNPCIVVTVIAAEWQRGIVSIVRRQAILMLLGVSIQVRKNMKVVMIMYTRQYTGWNGQPM